MRATGLLIGLLASSVLELGASGPASAKTLNVIASFTVLADVVKQVGDDHVNVKSLVGPNGDPHEFEPSPDDAKNSERSRSHVCQRRRSRKLV